MLLREPNSEDGIEVFNLIAACPPLDPNSIYCNLLQCSHFATTSVVAQDQNTLVGFISGYRMPDSLDTLFIWQVAVSDKARGQGLASKMICNILNRETCGDVNYIETSITESNRPSWALFQSIASHYKAELNQTVLFDKHKHFAATHDTEYLVRIGPLGKE